MLRTEQEEFCIGGCHIVSSIVDEVPKETAFQLDLKVEIRHQEEGFFFFTSMYKGPVAEKNIENE